METGDEPVSFLPFSPAESFWLFFTSETVICASTNRFSLHILLHCEEASQTDELSSILHSGCRVRSRASSSEYDLRKSPGLLHKKRDHGTRGRRPNASRYCPRRLEKER